MAADPVALGLRAMSYLTATAYLQDRAAETARIATPERYAPVDDVLLLLSAATGDRTTSTPYFSHGSVTTSGNTELLRVVFERLR